MPKESEAPVQQNLNITAEQLQDAMVAAMKTFVIENRKPTDIELAKIRNIEDARARERESAEQDRLAVVERQARCSHVHPHNGRSLFWRFPVCFPNDGWVLTCCRCYKQLKNYNEKQLIINEEFNKWVLTPSIVDVEGF